MDHMAKYYKNLSEHLFNQRDHLLRLLNEVAQAPKKSQSRLVDGVWVDDNGNPVEFNRDFGTNCTGRYKNHGKWAKPVWTKVHNMQGSPPTPYILDDLTNYSDIADAIMYWYIAGSEKREVCGEEGRRWAMNEGGINSKNMCNQFIKAMDFTLENFKPINKFDMYNFNGYSTKTLPGNALGFDLHKVDVDNIKKEVSSL